MFKFISKIFKRQPYDPIVKTLPHVLKHRYGTSQFYTIGQLNKTIEDSTLKPELIPIVHALFSSKEDFQEIYATNDSQDYYAIRDEIADLYNLDERDLNGKYLVRKMRPHMWDNRFPLGHGYDLPNDGPSSGDGGASGGD